MDFQTQKGIIIATVNCIVYRPYKSSTNSGGGSSSSASTNNESIRIYIHTYISQAIGNTRIKWQVHSFTALLRILLLLLLLLLHQYACVCEKIVSSRCSRRPLHSSLGLFATKKIREFFLHGDQCKGKFETIERMSENEQNRMSLK